MDGKHNFWGVILNSDVETAIEHLTNDNILAAPLPVQLWRNAGGNDEPPISNDEGVFQLPLTFDFDDNVASETSAHSYFGMEIGVFANKGMGILDRLAPIIAFETEDDYNDFLKLSHLFNEIDSRASILEG